MLILDFNTKCFHRTNEELVGTVRLAPTVPLYMQCVSIRDVLGASYLRSVMCMEKRLGDFKVRWSFRNVQVDNFKIINKIRLINH